MKALLVALARILDSEKFQTYSRAVGETLKPFGGEIIARGKAEASLQGEHHHQVLGVVRFPDMSTLESWYHSDDYQALVALREQAAEMTITTYSVPM